MKKISTSLALKLRQDSIVERDYIIFSGEETKHYIWFNLYDDCYNNGNFIGTFVMKRLELTYNDSDLEFKQKEFNAYKEYKLDDGTWESIDYGTFIVQAVEESDTKEEIKVTAYDYTLKFANTYVSELDYQSGEITLLQVLQECCDKCGIELATTEFANSSFKVDSNQFDGLSMYGNVIGAVAGISCNFAKIKADNKLYLEFKTETGIIIEASDYEEFEDKRDTLEYNAVSLGMANVEGENVTMVAKGVDPEKAKFLTINDNQFAYTIEKRNELITAIFNKINGFSYSSIVLKNCMFPQLECGDLIQVRNKDGQLVNSIVLRPTYEETQIKLEAPSTISSTVSYLNPPEAYDIAKLTQIEVDKAIGQIQSLTIRTEQIVDNINNNYYTVKQTNELIQTAESGITNTFSESGGNNIFRNTGLWFKNDGEDSKKDKTIIGSNIKLFDALDETVNNVRINGYTRQITTTGKQLYNYKDTSKVVGVTVDEEGWITATYDNTSGTSTRYLNYYTNNLDLKNNTNYLIVAEIKDVSGTGWFAPVTILAPNEGQFSKELSIPLEDLSDNMYTGIIKTKENLENTIYGLRSFVSFRAGQSGSITFRLSVLEDTTINANNFVYEPFSGGKPSPSPDNPQEVEVAKGKNLFYVEPKTLNGVTLSYANDGAIVLNGTATADCFFRTKLNNPIKTGSTLSYKVNSLISKVIIRTRNMDNTIQKELNTSVNLTNKLIKTSNDEQAEICVVNGTELNNYKIYVQLEKGSIANEYEPYNSIVAKSKGTIATEIEPYQESKITYPLGEEFLAEQDYIQDNKLYKNVARLILDGSEEWEISSFTNDTILSVFLNIKDMKSSSKFLMNQFRYIEKVLNDTDYEYCATGGDSIRIGVYKSRLQSADIAGFKQWLAENPVEIYYQLATTNTIELEPSGELKTYKDYTSISNNVNTEMEINYNAIYSIYEFWTGNVKKETNSNSSSYNSLLLQRGSLKQEQDVPNGNYSISFTYKKLIELANATVKINENEYNLDSLEYKQFYTGQQDENGNYITSPIEVSSGHISIEFITDANNSVEVYDIMCNKGNVKLAYSQNQNETTTDTVNISKGITITSSYMETIFKANANGIKILTLQGETIAYFTEKGLTTKEAIIEEKAEICGALITDVGDQTWFTRM